MFWRGRGAIRKLACKDAFHGGTNQATVEPTKLYIDTRNVTPLTVDTAEDRSNYMHSGRPLKLCTAEDRSHFGTAEGRSNEQRKTAYMDSGRPPTRTTDDRAYFFAQRHNTMLEPASPHPTSSHSHASPTSRLDLLILAVCTAVTQMMPSSVRW